MNKYMHTLNDQPAGFDGYQVCYYGGRHQAAIPLCNSLAQIRREQQTSIRNRRADGFDSDIRDYGYVRVAGRIWSE